MKSRTIICWICVLFIALIFPINITSSQCGIKQISFGPGEKLTYDAVYNWGFIWVNAGNVTFTVDEKVILEKSRFYFRSEGSSLKNYDWFYKVRDVFQSYADMNTLAPVWFERKTYEGGYEVHNRYKFDHNKHLVYSKVENSDQPYKEDTLSLPSCTFDLMTLVYFARCLDFSNYKINDTIPITTIIDNEIYHLYIRYLGKESLKTHDNKIYKCNKFSALLVEGTIFKGGEDLFVWVTDDVNRVPVLVEAKILIGSVKAALVSAENTLTPLSYSLHK